MWRGILEILKWTATIVLAFVVVALAFAGYGLYAEPRAKRKALAFCNSLKPGDSTDGIVAKARDAGASAVGLDWVKEPSGDRILLVTFVGLPPFSRTPAWLSLGSR